MFNFCGKQICRSAFQIVYEVRTQFRQFTRDGINPRIHCNKGRKAPDAFNFNEVRYIANNLQKNAIRNGIPHPAGPRGGHPDPPPSSYHVQTQKMKSTSSVPKSVERMGYAL